MEANAPPNYTTDMVVGDIHFSVEIEFSTSAKETAYSKIKRLILEDVEFDRHKVSVDTIAN